MLYYLFILNRYEKSDIATMKKKGSQGPRPLMTSAASGSLECGLCLTIIAIGVNFIRETKKFWIVSEVNMSLTFLMLLISIFLI